jgi:mono/diheme cytochrome c family protein/peroxiredoxin
MSRWLLFGGLCLVVLLSAIAGGAYARRWVDASTPRPSTATDATDVAMNPPAARRGALLYTVYCAKCHGDEGHGDAEGSAAQTPPPRDFATRPWRYEVTPTSIERVLAQGIPGTSMPSFKHALTSADVAALVEHVLALATPHGEQQPPDAFTLAGFTRLAAPRVAPPLQLQDAAGNRAALADYRGRVVLLNFWGVSCPHCLTHMDELAKLQAAFADRPLTILNICADEGDVELAASALASATNELTALVDSSGLANGRFEVSVLPTIWLVDPEGRLVAKTQGAPQWQDPKLAALLEELLR